jgi:hypothetical protein
VYLLTLAGMARTGETTAAEPAAGPTPIREVIGLDRLEQRLGARTPTGKGIVVGHVEGAVGDYMPNVASERFTGVDFTANNGDSKANGHTDATATIIYGPGGLAPGVTEVQVFAANPWMQDSLLGVGTNRRPTDTHIRLFNHSWVGGTDTAATREALRRVDELVDAHDVIVVCGVNNGRETEVPALLSSAYNAIAVGQVAGQNSGGYTRMEVAGRGKPDIIAPHGKTSFSTPIVTAVIARLLQAADTMQDTDAARAEVIKAVLLAGATKPRGWTQAEGHPLDSHFGAGTVRIDRSYDILAADTVQPGKVNQRAGWSFTTVQSGDDQVYTFDVPGDMGAASFMLVWHRRITAIPTRDRRTGAALSMSLPRMANFDLRLVHTDDQGKASDVAVSTSKVDNVEHIFLPALPHGRYELHVTRLDESDEAWDAAMAFIIDAK